MCHKHQWDIPVLSYRLKTGFLAAILRNVDWSGWNLAGRCSCTFVGSIWAQWVHGGLFFCHTKNVLKLQLYSTNVNNLHGKPINVWVADSAVVTNYRSFKHRQSQSQKWWNFCYPQPTGKVFMWTGSNNGKRILQRGAFSRSQPTNNLLVPEIHVIPSILSDVEKFTWVQTMQLFSKLTKNGRVPPVKSVQWQSQANRKYWNAP